MSTLLIVLLVLFLLGGGGGDIRVGAGSVTFKRIGQAEERKSDPTLPNTGNSFSGRFSKEKEEKPNEAEHEGSGRRQVS